jgi:hypothetical protein
LTTAQIDLQADVSGCLQAQDKEVEEEEDEQAHNQDTMRAEPNATPSSRDTKQWMALRNHNVLPQIDRPISYVTGEQVQTSVERNHVII